MIYHDPYAKYIVHDPDVSPLNIRGRKVVCDITEARIEVEYREARGIEATISLVQWKPVS